MFKTYCELFEEFVRPCKNSKLLSFLGKPTKDGGLGFGGVQRWRVLIVFLCYYFYYRLLCLTKNARFSVTPPKSGVTNIPREVIGPNHQ